MPKQVPHLSIRGWRNEISLGGVYHAVGYERNWLKSTHTYNILENEHFWSHSLSYGSIFGSIDQTDHFFSKSGNGANLTYQPVSNVRVVSIIETTPRKFREHYHWLLGAKIDFSLSATSGSICLEHHNHRSSIPQLGVGDWFQFVIWSSDQVATWKVVACGKLTSRMNDPAQNHDLRRFESTSYQKVCPKSVFFRRFWPGFLSRHRRHDWESTIGTIMKISHPECLTSNWVNSDARCWDSHSAWRDLPPLA
jgi:hypothetical protein